MAPRAPQGDLASFWRTCKAGKALKAKRRKKRSLGVTEHLLQAWLMQCEPFQRLGSPEKSPETLVASRLAADWGWGVPSPGADAELGPSCGSLREGLIQLLWISWHQISLREGQPGVNLLLTGFHELQRGVGMRKSKAGGLFSPKLPFLSLSLSSPSPPW